MEQKEQFSWGGIEPLCVVRRVLRQLPAIIAGGVIAVLCAWMAMTGLYHPTYTASTTLAVSVKSSSYASVLSNLSMSAEIAETFTTLFESNVFDNLAAELMGEPSLPGELSAVVIPETNLLVLTVTADRPDTAFRTLKLVLENYDSVSEQMFQNVILKELVSPRVPTAPFNPLNRGRMVKLAAVGGAGAVLALVLLLTLWADTVQNTAGLRRKVDARQFGVIFHESKNKTLRTKLRRTNKGLLVTMPVASFRFTETMYKLGVKLNYAAQNSGHKIILITSVAENEGKSTVAANLAITLAQQGKKVLLIDADMHKAAQYKILSHNPRVELADVLSGKGEYAPEYLGSHKLYVLLSKQGSRQAAEQIAAEQMGTLLEKARAEMDFVIIDSPPIALFSDVEYLADRADASLLVVRQDCMPAARINDAADMLRSCRSELLGCILNDVRTTPFFSESRRHGYGYGYGYGYGDGYGGYGGYGRRRHSQAEEQENQETENGNG